MGMMFVMMIGFTAFTMAFIKLLSRALFVFKGVLVLLLVIVLCVMLMNVMKIVMKMVGDVVFVSGALSSFYILNVSASLETFVVIVFYVLFVVVVGLIEILFI